MPHLCSSSHSLKNIKNSNESFSDVVLKLTKKKSNIMKLFGCAKEDIIHASAKEGIGITEILQAIVHRVPSPQGDADEPLQAMIFDSVFNPYRGIEVFFRVFNGTLNKADKVKFVNTGKTYEADEIGVLRLQHEPRKSISAGNVGYLISGIKVAKEV